LKNVGIAWGVSIIIDMQTMEDSLQLTMWVSVGGGRWSPPHAVKAKRWYTMPE